MTKMIWKAKDALSTVRAPKTHVRPNRDMIQTILIMSRTTEAPSLADVVLTSLCLLLCLCWIKTTTIMTNKAQLKRTIAKIGARKAAKKVAVLPMKHLHCGGTSKLDSRSHGVTQSLTLQDFRPLH